jgi:hypothetical protein
MFYKTKTHHLLPLYVAACMHPASPVFHPVALRPRILVVATAAAALCASALLLAVLHPQNAASSQLSAASFFSRVNPELASLMSPHSATQADVDDIDSSSSHALQSRHARSSSFYSDVSSRLNSLMRGSTVLAEDASEVRAPVAAAPAPRPSLQQHLPYDEASALGVPMSISSFEHVAAAVRGGRQQGVAVGVCHACVRAAAAAAKAMAKAKAEARAAKAADDIVRAARRKQGGDAAAAAAALARQRGIIAKLQVDSTPPLPCPAFEPFFSVIPTHSSPLSQKDPSFPAAAMQPVSCSSPPPAPQTQLIST